MLTTDPDDIRAAQRLRYDVFATEPGFALSNSTMIDADHFDQFCDHLIVREEESSAVVGCYRMLPPPGAIAAGGLYSATEFALDALDDLRPVMVEMGRAVVHHRHRNGAVVLMMWTGILAYMDRNGYDAVIGCVSVPVESPGREPGRQIRGVRDFVRVRHPAPAGRTVRPHRPVVIDGKGLDDIDPPGRPELPPLMRGYLRMGARILGDPAHDLEFGVGDFPALLERREADVRFLDRLRSAGAQ